MNANICGAQGFRSLISSRQAEGRREGWRDAERNVG